MRRGENRASQLSHQCLGLDDSGTLCFVIFSYADFFFRLRWWQRFWCGGVMLPAETLVFSIL